MIVREWHLPSMAATCYSAQAGEWEETLMLSDLEIVQTRSPAALAYRIVKMMDRVAQFDRLVREDRDW